MLKKLIIMRKFLIHFLNKNRYFIKINKYLIK